MTGAEAIEDLHTLETKLKDEATLKTLFASKELQKEYRDRFVETMDPRFGPVDLPNAAHPVANLEYDFSRTKDAFRTTINRLIGSEQPAPAPAPAPGEDRGDDRAEEHRGEDRPPKGGMGRKLGRTAGVIGLSGALGVATVLATKGLPIAGVPILGPMMNIPVLQSAAATVNTAATAVSGWTPWLSSWMVPILKGLASYMLPGLGMGALTVGGLWGLGKIREGYERRKFYKNNPTGRFEKKTFLQNVGGGAGLLLSPLKLIPGIPRALGAIGSWGAGKVGNGLEWVGKNTGTMAKGAVVGTLVGGTLLIASALTGPGALIVGAGCAGAYTWLNRKGASGSSPATSASADT